MMKDGSMCPTMTQDASLPLQSWNPSNQHTRAFLTEEQRQEKQVMDMKMTNVVMVTRMVIAGDRPRGSCSNRDWMDGGSWNNRWTSVKGGGGGMKIK